MSLIILYVLTLWRFFWRLGFSGASDYLIRPVLAAILVLCCFERVPRFLTPPFVFYCFLHRGLLLIFRQLASDNPR